MNNPPTTEDRIWAVLSHLSALLFGMGILLPVVGWSDQRRKSNYASFQCLQALGYQSVGFTVWVLSYLVLVILASIVLLFVLVPEDNSQVAPDILTPALIVFLIIVFAPLLIYLILPVIAAVACALGRDFRYPILGDRLARYLSYEAALHSEDGNWLHEDHEFRWVAAMGHLSILIMLWGMLAPLTAWMVQGRQNSFLKFQSIQTLLYQGITTFIYFIGGFLYLFGMVLFLASMGALGGPDFNSVTGIIGVVVMSAILLLAAVLILVVPILHILGQWAGYRVLRGENYHYPLIGKIVERRISRHSAIEEEPA